MAVKTDGDGLGAEYKISESEALSSHCDKMTIWQGISVVNTLL